MDQNMQSKGLGSDIKRITAATGLDKLAKKIAKLLDEDCGCDERAEKLDNWSKNWPMYKTKKSNK